MLKILFTATIVSFSIQFAHAQERIKLSVDNPAPRIGDEVELRFSMPIFSEILSSQLENVVGLAVKPSRGYRENEVVQTLTFEKVGNYAVGPFYFTINGEEFKTDSIVIEVFEALPKEEGLWVRKTEFIGTTYIIIEQIIKQKQEIKKDENSYSFTTAADKDEFAELKEEPQTGITMEFRSSRSMPLVPENGSFFGSGIVLNYSFKKFEVIVSDDFIGEFMLSEKDFIRLPKKHKIDIIEIKR
jgi:hypothetical protein